VVRVLVVSFVFDHVFFPVALVFPVLALNFCYLSCCCGCRCAADG
jgi:hypothetical protein